MGKKAKKAMLVLLVVSGVWAVAVVIAMVISVTRSDPIKSFDGALLVSLILITLLVSLSKVLSREV